MSIYNQTEETLAIIFPTFSLCKDYGFKQFIMFSKGPVCKANNQYTYRYSLKYSILSFQVLTPNYTHSVETIHF